MIRYECDKCGASMDANDPNRFIVKLEVYAATGHIEVSEAEVNAAGEKLEAIIEQLRTADPDEIENQVYRSFRFDVCNACQRALIANPLPRMNRG